jgi:hypothetical protein
VLRAAETLPFGNEMISPRHAAQIIGSIIFARTPPQRGFSRC